jgi:hypothetical protein
MIAPHRRNRKKPKTQDGRKLRRYKRLQEALEDRAPVRLARELPAPSDPLRAEGRELPWVCEAGVHRHPPEVFVRWLLALAAIR